MIFKEHVEHGVLRVGVAKWDAAGIFHGFFGRDFDLRTDLERSSKHLGLLANESAIELHLPKQVHSEQILNADDGEPVATRSEGDGWNISQRGPTAAYGVLTADCIPVLILDPGRKSGAVLHCGWRGALKGILPLAIHEMIKAGSRASDLEIAIGPGAQVCCYEVSPSFAREGETLPSGADGGDTISLVARGEKFYFDVPNFLASQAVRTGVPQDNVFSSKICSICDSRFFSHRREKGQAGRQLSFLSLRPIK